MTFLGRLQDLLATDAAGLDAAGKAEVLRAAAEALERTGQPVQCRIVPFMPGRRPEDEAAHPGLGSSEDVALILPDGEHDVAHLLYDVVGDVADPFARVVHRAGRIARSGAGAGLGGP